MRDNNLEACDIANMLLQQLQNARLNGDSWVTPSSSDEVTNFSLGPSSSLEDVSSIKIERLSIGPSFLEDPSTIKSAIKRGKKLSKEPQISSPSKRMKHKGLTLATVIPVESPPVTLMESFFTSDASPWDPPPLANKNPSISGPHTPVKDSEFCYSLSPPLPYDKTQNNYQTVNSNSYKSASHFVPVSMQCEPFELDSDDLHMVSELRIDRARGTTLINSD